MSDHDFGECERELAKYFDDSRVGLHGQNIEATGAGTFEEASQRAHAIRLEPEFRQAMADRDAVEWVLFGMGVLSRRVIQAVFAPTNIPWQNPDTARRCRSAFAMARSNHSLVALALRGDVFGSQAEANGHDTLTGRVRLLEGAFEGSIDQNHTQDVREACGAPLVAAFEEAKATYDRAMGVYLARWLTRPGSEAGVQREIDERERAYGDAFEIRRGRAA